MAGEHGDRQVHADPCLRRGHAPSRAGSIVQERACSALLSKQQQHTLTRHRYVAKRHKPGNSDRGDMYPIYQHLSPTGHKGIRGERLPIKGENYVHLRSHYPRKDLATRHRREIRMTVVADSGSFFLEERKERKRKANFLRAEDKCASATLVRSRKSAVA